MTGRRIHILYFAAVRELVARDAEDLTLPDEVRTIADLQTFLATYRPALAPYLSSVRFALNEEFVTPDRAVEDGATIALIPPVAGG